MCCLLAHCAALWFTGGVSDSGISTLPFMGQRGHLSFGRNSQSDGACLCLVQAGFCVLQKKSIKSEKDIYQINVFAETSQNTEKCKNISFV